MDWDDVSLYERQAATLVASWAAYATGSTGARVARSEGVSAAVFPTAPERGVYNNALLECGTDAARRSTAVETMERVYTDAGVDHYAAWVHESDAPMIGQLTGSGYRFDSSTRVMAMSLDAIPVPEPEIELGEASWEEYLRIIDGPDGLLAGVDPSAFHVLVARLDGRNAGTALAYDHDGDCGIYNVVTLPDARRRGIGSALTALQLHRARERGCVTASLQSTGIAERVYASVGFRDLGRYLEYVPG